MKVTIEVDARPDVAMTAISLIHLLTVDAEAEPVWEFFTHEHLGRLRIAAERWSDLFADAGLSMEPEEIAGVVRSIRRLADVIEEAPTITFGAPS